MLSAITRQPSVHGALSLGLPSQNCLQRVRLQAARPRPQQRSRAAVILAAEAPQQDDDQLYLQNGRPHLPSSLFRPFAKLPPDGKTLTPDEEACDPETSLCKTKIHVWEVKCPACYGTGLITASGSHGRRSLCTCLQCTGLGYVRHTSSQVEPGQEQTDCEAYYTLGRPALDAGQLSAKKRASSSLPRRPRPRRE